MHHTTSIYKNIQKLLESKNYRPRGEKTELQTKAGILHIKDLPGMGIIPSHSFQFHRLSAVSFLSFLFLRRYCGLWILLPSRSSSLCCAKKMPRCQITWATWEVPKREEPLHIVPVASIVPSFFVRCSKLEFMFEFWVEKKVLEFGKSVRGWVHLNTHTATLSPYHLRQDPKCFFCYLASPSRVLLKAFQCLLYFSSATCKTRSGMLKEWHFREILEQRPTKSSSLQVEKDNGLRIFVHSRETPSFKSLLG